jgi:hypothetical protein
LSKHLGDPLVRNTAGAEPGGVRRAEIVNSKTGFLCASGSCARRF